MPDHLYEVWMTALRRGKIEYERASLHDTLEAATKDAIERISHEAHSYLKTEVIRDDGVVWGMMSHRQMSLPKGLRPLAGTRCRRAATTLTRRRQARGSAPRQTTAIS